MHQAFSRRQFILSLGMLGVLPARVLALEATESDAAPVLIGAAWRGPKADDTYYAGVLAADWTRRTLAIRYEVPLPTRPHGLLAEAGNGLLITGARPGGWLLRCDGQGRVAQQVDVTAESANVRLSGHVVVVADRIYTTEIDYATDQGRIGVRDPVSLRKLDEWSSGGVEPHQLVLDGAGHLVVANGGLYRTLTDKKRDLARMNSSLTRMDAANGRLLGRWTLDDPRLSLRHLAWGAASTNTHARLGIALQAEHDAAPDRAAAPVLAVFEGETLRTPSRVNDGHGYAGDIAPAYDGGFAVSSNKAGVVQVWHPAAPDTLTTVVQLDESYALAGWPGPEGAGGVLIATALGLVRWHPSTPPVFLAWPRPMALDNHWVVMA